jgi:hypothetical protein
MKNMAIVNESRNFILYFKKKKIIKVVQKNIIKEKKEGEHNGTRYSWRNREATELA